MPADSSMLCPVAIVINYKYIKDMDLFNKKKIKKVKDAKEEKEEEVVDKKEQ